ncbi:hypothetical protein Acid345_2014 [Candidatus Koribacter versatilis Ellin345]|uniref:Uncharacterized protein n=1 Tax=Koribacter versatilis (strain Ellin345) TaxID=204669 RepID=Q1IQ35_KORVE|nr:hypothetical protein [Candidatus Koribacter versatilis]ABF41015.1 hypothetical protein Acid345_2014 [Candidatus Koribacter versatilis Ellin345]
MRTLFSLFTIVLLLPSLLSAQSDPPSLGDVARQNRSARKADDPSKPKQILENEDLGKYRGPIPEIAQTKASNSQEIIAAILAYSDKHSPEETETAVHQWYDAEIEIINAAVKHTVTLYQDRASPTSANALDQQHGYEDYRQYVQARADTQQRDLSDLKTLGEYQLVIGRVVGGLREVKNALYMQKRFKFEWFDDNYPQTHYIFMPNRVQQPPTWCCTE